MNRVILTGNVGKDPERIDYKNGKGFMVKFTLATSRSVKANGEYQEETQWHNILVKNQHMANRVMKRVRKGTKVALQGLVTYRKYEQGGDTKYFTEIVVDFYDGEVEAIANYKQDGEQDGGHDAGQQAADYSGQQAGQNFEDDIPFS